MKRTLLILAASALAFVAGRSIPRATPARAPMAAIAPTAGVTVSGRADEPGASPSLVSPPTTTGQPPPQDPTPRAETRMPAEWRDAVRAEPARANAVKQLVIQAMHVRADPLAIRECLRADGVSGGVLLRFEVDVDSETDELRVGDARFAEALEGPPISDAAGRCIAQQLAGIDLHDGNDLLAGYAGPVDYQLAINVPAGR